MSNRSTILGVMFGIITGAAWGLAFLIPNVLSNFSTLEITLGRYFMYGVYSLFIFFVYKKNPLHIPQRVWKKALLYAFTGNIGYFFFLVLGIKYAGATITTLIIGTLPIVISFVGNLLNKEFPFKIMMIPACSILIGIFFLYGNEQGDIRSVTSSANNLMLGFLCCFIALALWTWYGISNSNFLKKEREISSDLFSTIVGIQTLTIVIVILFISNLTNQLIITNLLVKDNLIYYLLGVMVLGIVASWVATWTWNQTSIRLSVSMAGMMIVFETIFGLLYTFIYEATFPSMMDWFSILFIIFGVTLGIWRINTFKKSEQKSSTKFS